MTKGDMTSRIYVGFGNRHATAYRWGRRMKQVCAWCQQEITGGSGPADGDVSHGICRECLDYFYPGTGKPPTFAMFLERLAVPVLVVDGNVRILHANGKACELFGKKPEDVEGKLGGEAAECVYARLPGGCGQTVHCKSCTIRRTVLDTSETACPHDAVPAYLDTETPRGVVQARFLITTAKVGGVVVLKIEAVDGEGVSIGERDRSSAA